MSTKLFLTASSSSLLKYAREMVTNRYRNSKTSAADALHLQPVRQGQAIQLSTHLVTATT